MTTGASESPYDAPGTYTFTPRELMEFVHRAAVVHCDRVAEEDRWDREHDVVLQGEETLQWLEEHDARIQN